MVDVVVPFHGNAKPATDGTKPCGKCGEVFPLERFLLRGRYTNNEVRHGSWCRACRVARAKKYNDANREKRAAYQAELMRTQAKLVRSQQRKYSRKIRQEMLDAYGRSCACCGESTEEFLSLEHLNGDGKDHAERLGGRSYIYRDLKKRGWPKDDYALYCMNCNWGSRRTGICPHQMARLLEEVAS